MNEQRTHSPRIAFVGVGRMGSNMARRLRDQGLTISAVSDVDRDRATGLAAELGCTAASTLPEVTAAADVVLTVVTDDAAMREIYSPGGGALLDGAAGKIFINCATITPDVHRDIERLVAAAGGASVEACMASSITQAREGSLYLLCAGNSAAYDRVVSILRQLGTPRYVGASGRAAEVKALVNMLMNINTAALAEALGLGAALGIDLDTLRDVFAHTGANSRVLATDGADMQMREHEVYFSAEHATKDSGIALALADMAHLDLPLARVTKIAVSATCRSWFSAKVINRRSPS